jgi:hypothetical protein
VFIVVRGGSLSADVTGDPGQIGSDLSIYRDKLAGAATNVNRERLSLRPTRSQPGGIA